MSTQFSRRDFGKFLGVGAAVATLAPLTLLEACSKESIASLVQILGTAGASVADLFDDSSIAAMLVKDTDAAVKEILAWQNGSPVQMAIEALNILARDYALIPVFGGNATIAALVTLGIGTIDAILSMLIQHVSTFVRPMARRHESLQNPPRTVKEFKRAFNAIVDSDPDPKYKALELK